MHLFYITLSSIIQPVKWIVNIVTRYRNKGDFKNTDKIHIPVSAMLQTASLNLKQYDSGD